MVTLADLIEAEVLTSERGVRSLLQESYDIAHSEGMTAQAETLQRRLRAMP